MCYNMEKYTEKKQRNQVFQKFIKRHIGENQMDLVEDCNTFLSFVADKTLEKQKLYKANSCKNRFCPVCAWRKARKDALGLSLMMQYIKQQEWLDLWRDVTGISEITQVQVQKIRQNNNKELYEMAKYSGKDSDYLINQKVFDAFYKSLKGKQVLVYSGLFKEAKKKLKNGDLDYLKEIDPTEYIYQIFYIWKQKEYLASELYDLTEQEKREINHKMIDEIEEEQ